MIANYDDLTPDALAPLGFADAAHACRLLQSLAGHDVPDAEFERLLRVVIPIFTGSADPDQALANFARWAEAVSNRRSAYALLGDSPAVADILLSVFAASQFLADLLVATPEYVEILSNPTLRTRPRDADALRSDLSRRVAIAHTPNAKRDALRRFKPPEILRIAVRDLLGDAPMPETARALSDFADVCVEEAVRICREEAQADFPFAVIALGKLGGQELNYASDIDLMFVHGDDADARAAVKLGETIRDTLAKATDAGFVFRVDLRLRPEGRFGPISRSLSSCRAYYESWAEPWERQALLKARFVAGDAALGAAWEDMAGEFVFGSRVEEKFVDSIRQNKRRLEEKIARAGESETNVKEGVGGIRDIEFAVQLIQLIAGGARPEIRTGNTLDALEKLTNGGLLLTGERDTLRGDYPFLRAVEHRLQLQNELAVRVIPTETNALRTFGRRLGYADGDAFLADYRRRTARVNALFRRLFYGGNVVINADELAAWVAAPDDEAARTSLRAWLTEHHFTAADDALRQLRRAVAGSEYGGISPDARASFVALAGPLLRAAAETNGPDSALRGFDLLADAVPSRAALFRTLADAPALLPRLVRLAGDAPAVWQVVLRHPELLDLLSDDAAMDAPVSLSPAPNRAMLAARIRRERLKTAARDVWGLADTAQVGRELTRIAEDALEGALTIARAETGFAGRLAIIGLGKLGGGELSYGGDLDVLYVGETGELDAAASVVEQTQRILQDELTAEGVRYELDARLRPDGRKGALVLDLATYQKYYETAAQTWERQALLKARWVAGDADLGAAWAALAEEFVYEQPLTDAQTDEIRAMKQRIETERLKNPNDLKLGAGGLTDIEWTAQLLLLRHGSKNKRLRATNTQTALQCLRDDALMTQSDWETLSDTYAALTRARNRLYLQTGVSTDAPAALSEGLKARMDTARAVCRLLFFGAA